MSERKRYSGPERRQLILQSAVRVFAQKGFEGATSRELAEAAGVSEGLLYKHFPSKEAMFNDLASILVSHKDAIFERMTSAPPSGASFIRAFHFLARVMLFGPPGRPYDDSIDRLMVQSLLGDGSFAETFLDSAFKPMKPYLIECLEAGWNAGEIDTPLAPGDLQCSFFHHFIGMIATFRLPGRSMLPSADGEEIFQQAMLFSIRGIGFTEAAIKEHVDFRSLRKLFDAAFKSRVD